MSNCDRDHNEPQSQQYLLSDVLQKKVCQPFEIRLGLLSKCLKWESSKDKSIRLRMWDGKRERGWSDKPAGVTSQDAGQE